MNKIYLKNISMRFGSHRALEDVSLKLESGAVQLLAGPNGAGKSTLIRVLLGLVRPTKGEILLDGVPTKVDNAFKEKLAYLPEAVAFSENLTGSQVMRFFASARQVSKSHAKSVLERVGLAHASGRAVRGYSRGMRQRLGLAVAIVAEPELLVLDEPTGGLDQEGLSLLWSILDEWRQKDRHVLIASHDLALMERRVDGVCLLKSGRVLATDSPVGLREKAGLPVTVHFRASDEESVEPLVALVQTQNAGAFVQSDACTVKIQVRPPQLMKLLDLGEETRSLVEGIRVEEPGLDAVYEHLLGEAAQ